MKLEATTIPANTLTADQIATMLRLMQSHYEGVSESQFLADLQEKNWVILLREEETIRGFSTQKLFEHSLDGEQVNVLFSGDTIIDKNCWGSQALPIAWGRLMNRLLVEYPQRELYWLLTSKGYKTYRFLPVFFCEYFPQYAVESPPEMKRLRDSLAAKRFGARFNPDTGVLRAEMGAQRLRGGIAELDDQRLRDPYIAFFAQCNPGHARGDELVCLARWHPENLTPYIRRQL